MGFYFILGCIILSRFGNKNLLKVLKYGNKVSFLVFYIFMFNILE